MNGRCVGTEMLKKWIALGVGVVTSRSLGTVCCGWGVWLERNGGHTVFSCLTALCSFCCFWLYRTVLMSYLVFRSQSQKRTSSLPLSSSVSSHVTDFRWRLSHVSVRACHSIAVILIIDVRVAASACAHPAAPVPATTPPRVFTIRRCYRRVCQLRAVGHSLGGGVAALLALLLKPAYPTVRALAVSPPGGLVSEGACREV